MKLNEHDQREVDNLLWFKRLLRKDRKQPEPRPITTTMNQQRVAVLYALEDAIAAINSGAMSTAKVNVKTEYGDFSTRKVTRITVFIVEDTEVAYPDNSEEA